MRFSLAAIGVYALGAYAQTTAPYTDPATGISFSRHVDYTGVVFGMALPESPQSDLIGQIAGPLNGTGYIGISLGGGMINNLLLVVYPNGNLVTTSTRVATGYGNPTQFSGSTKPTMVPISGGTSVNSTYMTFTFLCRGCITGDDYSFKPTDTIANLGFSRSSQPPSDPSSPTATLKFHDKGYGQFSMLLASAKSAEYDTWAAMASTNSTMGKRWHR